MKTTLNKIREHSPCASGWAKLLATLNKTKSDDDQVSFLTILESNGLDDALWCLRSATEYNRDSRLFAVWCARHTSNYVFCSLLVIVFWVILLAPAYIAWMVMK